MEKDGKSRLKARWDEVESLSRFESPSSSRLLFAHDPPGLRHAEGASAPQTGQARGMLVRKTASHFALTRPSGRVRIKRECPGADVVSLALNRVYLDGAAARTMMVA